MPKSIPTQQFALAGPKQPGRAQPIISDAISPEAETSSRGSLPTEGSPNCYFIAVWVHKKTRETHVCQLCCNLGSFQLCLFYCLSQFSTHWHTVLADNALSCGLGQKLRWQPHFGKIQHTLNFGKSRRALAGRGQRFRRKIRGQRFRRRCAAHS